ncbi:MAG: prepilin-type N-terminal cleavage/methylation domain-containing protein [Phycisphaerales bacterium]
MTRAFTLIEMVVSLTIMSIVFLAMGSVMLMTTKAIPAQNNPCTLALTAGEVSEQIIGELQTATGIITASGNQVGFTVPDRASDADTNDETISYTWSGTPGDPIYRQYNGGTPVEFAAGVQAFSLTYDVRSVLQPDTSEESAEVLLANHSTVGSSGEFPVTQYNWAGQLITPGGLPADTIDWNVTRVLLYAKRYSGNTGKTQVQIRNALIGGTPGSTVIESQLMSESLLSSNYAWSTYTFTGVRGISPSDKLCLVLYWQADNESAGIGYNPSGGSGYCYTYTKGLPWLTSSSQSLYYQVYGTYTTPVPQPPVNLIRSVSLVLNFGTDAMTESRSAVVLLNQPKLP